MIAASSMPLLSTIVLTSNLIKAIYPHSLPLKDPPPCVMHKAIGGSDDGGFIHALIEYYSLDLQ